nr:PREDICTED: transcription factor HES-7-like [Latimeria chalumnae]|eukprot:XP_014349219.1 PREDICTED: transcription factor HES-7-like [Latimeria chalumnae]
MDIVILNQTLEEKPPKKYKTTSVLYKKSIKPLIEKRRRGRINASIEQLKTVLLQNSAQQNSNVVRMEKADILEMTVQHLQKLKRTDAGPKVERLGDFTAGYHHCLKMVGSFLNSVDTIDHGLKSQIFQHLQTSQENAPYLAGRRDGSPQDFKTADPSLKPETWGQQKTKMAALGVPSNTLPRDSVTKLWRQICVPSMQSRPRMESPWSQPRPQAPQHTDHLSAFRGGLPPPPPLLLPYPARNHVMPLLFNAPPVPMACATASLSTMDSLPQNSTFQSPIMPQQLAAVAGQVAKYPMWRPW